MKQIKKFVVDTFTNLLFWHPLLGIFEYFILGFTTQELLLARFGNFLFAVLMGGVYGRAIDMGRYLLNKPYYKETIHHQKRKIINWKTQLHDASVDILTTCVYWGIIMGVWLYFIGEMSLTKVIDALLLYTIVQIIMSGLYGKVLNWSRKHFKV